MTKRIEEQLGLFSTNDIDAAPRVTTKHEPKSAVSVQHREDINLPGGYTLSLYRSWLDEHTAHDLFVKLKETVQWQQPSIAIAGKMRTIPRLQAWFAHHNAAFVYSGTRFAAEPVSVDLNQFRRQIEHQTQHVFNSVLVNYYRDQYDSVGWHADDEPEFGIAPTIASLSLGGSRRFFLKPKPQYYEKTKWKKRKPSIKLDLKNGDLLIMHSGVQSAWLHCVPKELNKVGERLNLTFRYIGTD